MIMLMRLLVLSVSIVVAGQLMAAYQPVNLEEKPPKFELSTSAFLDEGVLPVLYTCDGKDLSPQIAWTNPPPKTKSFALIMSDPLAPKGTFYHWVLFNMSAKTTEIAEGMQPLATGSVLGQNDFGKTQYNGPCPPKGSAHTYIFTVYALDSNLSLKKGATAKDVLAAMQKHMLGQSKLTAVYSRWIQ